MYQYCLLSDLLYDLCGYFDKKAGKRRVVLAKYLPKRVNPPKGGYVGHTANRSPTCQNVKPTSEGCYSLFEKPFLFLTHQHALVATWHDYWKGNHKLNINFAGVVVVQVKARDRDSELVSLNKFFINKLITYWIRFYTLFMWLQSKCTGINCTEDALYMAFETSTLKKDRIKTIEESK